MAIPASVWNAETHHKGIWQANGPCVKCLQLPRQACCPRCMEPMCGKCLNAHTTGKDHARDRYIERMARHEMSWANCTIQECDEANALKLQWAEAAEPKPLAVSA